VLDDTTGRLVEFPVSTASPVHLSAVLACEQHALISDSVPAHLGNFTRNE
jgi:hypothetical protein